MVSNNPYLLRNYEHSEYQTHQPRVEYDISASRIRELIANTGDWKQYVPPSTLRFLLKPGNLSRLVGAIAEVCVPPYVSLEVTNRCNMGCPFCFLGVQPEGARPDESTERILELIERLAAAGARMINYSGGEPLLRRDIVDLVSHGKKLGLSTILSTNGIKLNEKKAEDLARWLDWLSLPVDGPCAEVHDSVRGRRGHFARVMRLLDMMKATGVATKVNTMVCKKNVNFIRDTGTLLDGLEIRRWKLFQFSARGKAAPIRDEYAITEEAFTGAAGDSSHAFDVVRSYDNYRDNAYFLVEGTGNVTVPCEDKYLQVGNLLRNPLATFKSSDALDWAKNTRNATVSYDLATNT